MLDQSLLEQVKTVFASLQNNYTLEVTASNSHPSKVELVTLLEEVASCSDKISTTVIEGENLSFKILKNGVATSILFRAVPTGHEFTSLLLAILNADGIGKNLPDEVITAKIKALAGNITVNSYISLSCTNCPDVVQALNIISLINPNITHQIIDGSINQDEVEKLNIQAVPAVYVNDKVLHVGRSSLGELLTKLEEVAGSTYEPSAGETKKYDVVVVGGGPAGVSAAIYSARKGFKVALVAEKVGGQVTETVGIENFISVAKTTGAELTANLKLHLKDYPIDVLENRRVDKVAVNSGIKQITTSLGEELIAPALIVTTGASWRKLNVPGETQYIGSGVAFCTHCDGPFYKGKKVVVVGGGNSGLEAAIDLSSIATHVTVLEFLPEVKGDKVLQDKLKTLSNVEIITNAETVEVHGDGAKVNALSYKERTSGEVKKLVTDGVFVQIGLTANSSVVKDIVATNRVGEIIIDAHCRTNVPGIYAAGDVSIVPYKQIVIAMGEGAKAALSAFDDTIKGQLVS